jgi:alpha-L-fucosidase 2
MRRRDFLKKGTVAVGLASSPKLLPPLTAGENSLQNASQISGPSADYLRRMQGEKFLPKPPAFAESSQPAAVQISPMPLTERLKRRIVPRRGFCSIAPGATLNEGLTSGNGAMNIEMTCDPYSEQILFHQDNWASYIDLPVISE